MLTSVTPDQLRTYLVSLIEGIQRGIIPIDVANTILRLVEQINASMEIEIKLGQLNFDAHEQHNSANSIPRESFTPNKGMRKADFIKITKEIIIQQNRPLQKQEIFEGFRAKGRHIGGNNPIQYLNVRLFRAKDEIILIPGAGYWPKDRPCPQADYYPYPPPKEKSQRQAPLMPGQPSQPARSQ